MCNDSDPERGRHGKCTLLSKTPPPWALATFQNAAEAVNLSTYDAPITQRNKVKEEEKEEKKVKSQAVSTAGEHLFVGLRDQQQTSSSPFLSLSFPFLLMFCGYNRICQLMWNPFDLPAIGPSSDIYSYMGPVILCSSYGKADVLADGRPPVWLCGRGGPWRFELDIFPTIDKT